MAGMKRLIALIAVTGGLLALPGAASAAVIYDQTDHAGTATANPGDPNFSPSNNFSPGSEDRTADDFIVPAGETWSINEVDVGGAYSGSGATQQVNVYIYSDAAGQPGSELFSQMSIPATGGPDYAVPLTGVPVLTAGTYWVTVQQVDASVAFWSWQTRTTQTGNAAKWRTSGPSGPPCPGGVWTVRTTCWPGTNPDQIFKLQGTKTTPPPPYVPSMQLGKLERNKQKGTGKVPVTVNGPGTLVLAGKGVVTKTRTLPATGTVKLLIKPKGKTARKLNEQGHVRTQVEVTYTPETGPVLKRGRVYNLRKLG
jgi:hypothetical protein